jgi:hypothetical protein
MDKLEHAGKTEYFIDSDSDDEVAVKRYKSTPGEFGSSVNW